MKDKVQKIREEVVRLQKRAEHNLDTSLTENGKQFWLGESNVLTLIRKYINTLQEEPKTDWLQELQERLSSLSKEDFEKVMAKYRRYGEEGSVDYDKLNTMLDESLSTETKESWNKRLGEEPVSENLEDAAEDYCKSTLIGSHYIKKNAFKAGAKWQKEQFEKNRLKHCDSITNEQAELEQKFVDQHLDKYQRTPTFLDAIEYGMRLKEEQMMAKVIDAQCFGFRGAALFSFRLPVGNYLVGSKVKVIVIKED